MEVRGQLYDRELTMGRAIHLVGRVLARRPSTDADKLFSTQPIHSLMKGSYCSWANISSPPINEGKDKVGMPSRVLVRGLGMYVTDGLSSQGQPSLAWEGYGSHRRQPSASQRGWESG
ncbi:unnamed protein product [Amaranthus hypochondriacus]